ncbi:carboxypeptidase-like regulatory domain-containing protein [Mucilaginibacter glaciei]|uniref:Carboxypeptidase-like regulatory domain-containing protein n=1 Tax=Mucilaginibacter glaciei TaxID=2772109 RepID=A0A926NYM7_9SPHI|nr:carboxypeptidase-like regulatory domain-containing protein [Mucilaginibacter glaciei]MBD1394303.1 carboxypeptidase-like regulatory domain-containing protein [Mucilaginibacter glaciei]
MRFGLLLFLLLPVVCLAQLRIMGRVVNAADKKPVDNASVFLSNATVGGKSNNDGAFTLTNVRGGQYELVVSVVGYETCRQTVMVNNADIVLPVIAIVAKTTELNVVNIRPDPNWERNYDNFKREFLGSSEVAKQCKILNPEMLDLEFDPKTVKLTASSYDFLEIENKALGYRVKYLLTQFIKDGKKNTLYFEGSALFENMKGSKADLKRWEKKRNQVYIGSSMHFLRSIIANTVPENNFQVFRLIRTPNPAYNGFNHRYFQTLVNTPLLAEEYVKQTDQRGLFALKYRDCLYIDYNKKAAKDKGDGASLDIDQPEQAATIVAFAEAYALFDNNGVITTPSALIFEGSWGKARTAEMLPVDFEPAKKQ